MKQTIATLTDGDLDQSEQLRTVITRYLDEDRPTKLATVPGKLGTLRARLKSDISFVAGLSHKS